MESFETGCDLCGLPNTWLSHFPNIRFLQHMVPCCVSCCADEALDYHRLLHCVQPIRYMPALRCVAACVLDSTPTAQRACCCPSFLPLIAQNQLQNTLRENNFSMLSFYGYTCTWYFVCKYAVKALRCRFPIWHYIRGVRCVISILQMMCPAGYSLTLMTAFLPCYDWSVCCRTGPVDRFPVDCHPLYRGLGWQANRPPRYKHNKSSLACFRCPLVPNSVVMVPRHRSCCVVAVLNVECLSGYSTTARSITADR